MDQVASSIFLLIDYIENFAEMTITKRRKEFSVGARSFLKAMEVN